MSRHAITAQQQFTGVAPCHKVAYPSKAIARGAVRAANVDGLGLKGVYRCPSCDKWHVTHSEQKRERR